MDEQLILESLDSGFMQDAIHWLHTKEREEVLREVKNKVYEKAIAKRIFGNEILKVREGDKVIYTESRLTAKPRYSSDFMDEAFGKPSLKDDEVYLVGIFLDTLLSHSDIEKSRSADIFQQDIIKRSAVELSALVQDAEERHLWLGNSARDIEWGSIKSGIEGFANWTGIQAFTEGDCTLANGIYETVNKGIATLIKEGYRAPYHVVMTRLLFAKSFELFNATTGKSDGEMIYGLKDEKGTPLIKSWDLSKHLIAEDEDATNQVCMVIADKDPNGQDIGKVLESVPFTLDDYQHHNAYRLRARVKSGALVFRPLGIAKADAIATEGV